MRNRGASSARNGRNGRVARSINGSLYPADALKRRAMKWAVKLKVNPRQLRVQDMRRKWGSCSTVGTVTFAYDLTQQDVRFQDFVIVHELLHLKVRNHGRVFKALLTAHVPRWREMDVLRKGGNTRRLEFDRIWESDT